MNNIELAQTVAQAHRVQVSLWDFLLALPSTQEAQIFYALVLGSALGMIGHYIRRWTNREIEGCIWDYFWRQDRRRSVLAMIGIISWSAGEVSAGLFTTPDGSFVGWALVILSGLKTGYAGDSLLNKGKQPGSGPITVISLPPAPGGTKP